MHATPWVQGQPTVVGQGMFCDFPYLNNFSTNGLEKITCLRNESSQEDGAASVKQTLETKDEEGWAKTKPQMMKMHRKKKESRKRQLKLMYLYGNKTQQIRKKL